MWLNIEIYVYPILKFGRIFVNVMVTTSDQKFEPLILCLHPIPLTPGMIS